MTSRIAGQQFFCHLGHEGKTSVRESKKEKDTQWEVSTSFGSKDTLNYPFTTHRHVGLYTRTHTPPNPYASQIEAAYVTCNQSVLTKKEHSVPFQRWLRILQNARVTLKNCQFSFPLCIENWRQWVIPVINSPQTLLQRLPLFKSSLFGF